MLPPLKTLMWENLSGLAQVITRVCMPPIERLAMAAQHVTAIFYDDYAVFGLSRSNKVS